MMERQVEGWNWAWREQRFLVLLRPNGREAAVIGRNKRLGWLWSLRGGPGHKTPDAMTAVRESLEALEMKEKTRERLLAVAHSALVRLGKIDPSETATSEIEDDDEVEVA